MSRVKQWQRQDMHVGMLCHGFEFRCDLGFGFGPLCEHELQLSTFLASDEQVGDLRIPLRCDPVKGYS